MFEIFYGCRVWVGGRSGLGIFGAVLWEADTGDIGGVCTKRA
jgi:hypothetical protein